MAQTDKPPSPTLPDEDYYRNNERSIAPPPSPTLPDEAYYHNNERSNARHRWGVILLVIGVIWLVFQLSSQGIGGLGFVERSVPIEARSLQGRTLEIVGINDEIQLLRGQGSDIVVEGERHGFGWNAAAAEQSARALDITIEQNGNTVRVEVKRQPTMLRLGNQPYAYLRISVPNDTQLDVQSTNGAIIIDDIQARGKLSSINGSIEANNTEGDLELHSTNGAIRLAEHRGSLTLESINGSISVEEGAGVEHVAASTVNGSISLEEVGGRLELQSISGDIDIHDVRDAQLDIESTSGDITMTGSLAENRQQSITSVSGAVHLRLPSESNLRLALQTLSGDLETDFEIRDAIRARRSLSGVTGTGSTNLTINTTSGDIEIERD